ncbi:MAG: recombinase A [Spirochaetales bacterium]|nr:MAG: recombinase A [Spirochaetales bacterium]
MGQSAAIAEGQSAKQRGKPSGHGLRKATDLIDLRNLGGAESSTGVVDQGRWSRKALSGYLTELVGGPTSANLTMTGRLILLAQNAGEFVAWVATHRDVFFPPDLAALGVDLATLPVIWADEPHGNGRIAGRASRVAERLLRSGAFGLVIIDLAKNLTLNAAAQGRLLRLAEHNDAQVLILRRKREDGNYSGSLVTVRAESTRKQIGPGRFRCTIMNTKDKREGPGWTTSEEFDGPPGMY